jgi:Carbonic anhydrase
MRVFRLAVTLSLFLMDCHILALSPWQIVKNRFGKAIDMPPPEIIPPPPTIIATPVVSTVTSTFVDKNLEDVFAANQEWISSMKGEDPAFFEKLGSIHQPDYMWIGCADARVPANEVMGKEAGTVFVVRNVANMVVNTDVNLMAALQYAVNVLKVSHIIVCGHYDCGGIRAASANKDHQPPLENWLRNIRDVYVIRRIDKQPCVCVSVCKLVCG